MAKNIKDRVIEHFGKAADGYIHDRGFATGPDLEEAVRLLKPTEEDVVLDVATGGGHTALFFAPLVRNVVASDLTMQMLKKAQEHISEEGGVENVTFREADAEDLPFPSGSFTILTCRIAPHHFPDVPRSLKEFHRVLRRRVGKMVIIDTLLPDDPEIADFYQTMEKMRDPTHIQAYTEEQWRQMVEAAGFAVEKTAIFEKTHDFKTWAKRAG
ncbi:MAG: methyltransferase domain-containing protein, partial [Desulfuromonadales bacterium]|nr:methyltransferase domain-containing protein [Desulfuromonadales bacterium]NIS41750.1 methyltransferase domain-containing protein [Desulfuromonadales bacterium]